MATGCGSRTIAGGAVLPDGAAPDDAVFVDTPFTPDEPSPFDVQPDLVRPDAPVPPVDRPVTVDVLPPVDRPLPPDVPLVERCEDATRLTPDVTLRGESTGSAPAATLSCAALPPIQPTRWYRVAVPAGQALTVTATPSPTSRWPAQARLVASCAGACLAATSTTGPDGRSTVQRWVNTGPTATDVVVAVGSLAAGLPATYDITASLGAATTNSTCERAAVVRDGTLLRGEDPSSSSTTLAPCPGMAGTTLPGALFYTADVPAGQTLTASATATVTGRGFNHVRVFPSCADATCLAATSTPSPTASTSWTNTGVSPRRVLIAVTPAAGTPSPFDLGVRVRPPPTNAACMGATRLTAGTLVGESLAFAREVTPACLAFGAPSGPVLYYTARVGEGERLTVVARRTSSNFFQPLVRVIDACGGATCLASSAATPMGGDSSRITWVNPGAARDVVVLVSSSSATADGTFDLTTALGATPYRMAPVPGACDALTSPTVVTGAVGDDVGTASTALPFAFRYFGAAVTSWSVSTNGYLQVWPAEGRSTGALGASELPSPTAPPSMIAPFWDDLEVDAAAASVRSQVFAGAPRHLTVEWTNVRFCCGGGTTDRLTFQAKLFEGSDAIEFHYCALSFTPRATGANASIGIQDATSTQGLSWGIRRAGAASVTTGVRFSPM